MDSFTSKAAWEELINKRSTTYRNLTDDQKHALESNAGVLTVLEQPTLLKRPVLVNDDQLLIGFKAEKYRELLLT